MKALYGVTAVILPLSPVNTNEEVPSLYSLIQPGR